MKLQPSTVLQHAHLINRSQAPFHGAGLRRYKLLRGFTLIELLIVIAIITILLTIGALGLKNMGKSTGVSAGVPVAEAVFDEARSLAIGKGVKTRVVIHAKQNTSIKALKDRYLRYMVIQYFDVNKNKWMLPPGTKPIKLPKGVYYLVDKSQLGGPDIPKNQEEDSPMPQENAEGYYYEFNPEGMIVNPLPTETAVPRFVIGQGSLPPGSAEPKGVKSNTGGFVIWRNGTTSVFRSPKQIDPSL